MFNSILEVSTTANLSAVNVFICILVSGLLGIIISFVHAKTTKHSKNFIITLAILPMLVQLIIMLVNGNLGASIATMGAFSLVRFKSIAGNSREIASVLFAMVIGLAVGMGFVVFATIFTLIISLLFIIYSKINFANNTDLEYQLKVVIPENLNVNNLLDDIFSQYTNQNLLEKVKTTNMGSMYELSYNIELKKDADMKKLLDEIRTRNGNLNVILSKKMDEEGEL